ncbi:MAG: GTPase Era [Candidatus Omnitrophica bacterium]|nr:GTPase Era [Candidatus Omnitrophota bacterium]
MKSGFVAIIGRPNVGKSTLLNRLVGEKLSAVSPKPQTTRHPIRGIFTTPEGQIIFLDTPGIHRPVDSLGTWMIREVEKILPEADLVVWMVLPKGQGPEEAQILETLKAVNKPVILAINQIDRHKKAHILPVLAHYQNAFPFREMIPISAMTGEQTDILVEKIFEYLPEGPLLFPEDQISDQNERFIVREMISEKLFLLFGEEIPYSTTVVIDDFQEEEKLISIKATIIVERDSQKAIVIGQGGQKIKELGQAARLDIEKFLDRKVFLELWVKTIERWKKDQGTLKRLGYE